jgi:hypothetical protein
MLQASHPVRLESTQFPADVTPGEFMTASASAMQMYIREERLLRSVKAA